MRHYSTSLPLPDSTDQSNEITETSSASRPHLSKPANRRRLSSLRGRATQVTQGKKIESRGKKLRGLLWSSCETNTDFHPSLPVKPVSQDRTQSSTSTGRVSNRKLFGGSSENNLPLFSLSVYLNWVSSPFVRSSYHLEKGEPSCYFYFNLCFNCSFYPCGPWWLRTVILWWCSLGQQLVQMGVNWVRMKGK